MVVIYHRVQGTANFLCKQILLCYPPLSFYKNTIFCLKNPFVVSFYTSCVLIDWFLPKWISGQPR